MAGWFEDLMIDVGAEPPIRQSSKFQPAGRCVYRPCPVDHAKPMSPDEYGLFLDWLMEPPVRFYRQPSTMPVVALPPAVRLPADMVFRLEVEALTLFVDRQIALRRAGKPTLADLCEAAHG